MHEYHGAGGALDQGADRGLVGGAGDEVSPRTLLWAISVLSSYVDNNHGIGTPIPADLAGILGFAPGPSGSKGRLYLATQAAAGQHVEGLIDRLW